MHRRHDIDALRVIAFAFLILYHVGMLYVSEWGWHIKSSYQYEALQLPMLFLNRWRMDLIFLISGMAAAFLLKPGQTGRFLALRSGRLLLPLTFGIVVIVPTRFAARAPANIWKRIRGPLSSSCAIGMDAPMTRSCCWKS